jgi:GNAT superfamily N-acetyltransferase
VADLPRILDLGEQMHAESPRWSRLSFNRIKAGKFLQAIIESADGVIFLAERGGVVMGGIVGMVSEHWCSNDRVADELSLFLAPEARGGLLAVKLVKALEAWADLRGAAWLQVGTSTGLDPEGTARLYEAVGFTRCAIGLEVSYG